MGELGGLEGYRGSVGELAGEKDTELESQSVRCRWLHGLGCLLSSKKCTFVIVLT